MWDTTYLGQDRQSFRLSYPGRGHLRDHTRLGAKSTSHDRSLNVRRKNPTVQLDALT